MWVPRNKRIKKMGGSSYKFLSERADILMREIYWHIYQWKLGFINEKKKSIAHFEITTFNLFTTSDAWKFDSYENEMLDMFTCTCNILEIYMVFKLRLYTHCLLIHTKKVLAFKTHF